MAHDWIKMRTNLADDPAVIGIAATVRLDRHSVVGRLHTLWSWADAHTIDGYIPNITTTFIDEKAARKGFARAMAAVHWLNIDTTGVTFPHFDRHNGESAKKRALETDKKRHQRAGQNPDNRPEPVPLPTGQTTDNTGTKTGTREEKEKSIQQQPPRRLVSISDFPTLAQTNPGIDLPAELEKARVHVRAKRGPKAEVEHDWFIAHWLPKAPITTAPTELAPPGFAAWFDLTYPDVTPEVRAQNIGVPWPKVHPTLRTAFEKYNVPDQPRP